jgi:hypothetical protein
MNYPKPDIINIKSLKQFLDLEMHKLLPNQEIIIKNHLNLVEYLESESPFFVLRKFKNYSNRGSNYSIENHSFTVSDNEPALWVFMETFNQYELDFSELIENQKFPIAFAIKEEEKLGNIWQNKGRKHPEFAANGWKHCHIFQCSPTGEKINHKNDLKKRSLRLLSPLNHFPFFSPRRYIMPYDYGENRECIDYVIWWLYNHFYSDKNKIHFRNFIENQNYSIPNEEPKDIYIEYSSKEKKSKNFISIDKPKATTRIKNSISKNKNDEVIKEISSFRLVQNWYGRGFNIIVRFKDGRVYQYNHDMVYDNTIMHYENLNCWIEYGSYSSSKNIPKIAKPFVTKIDNN